MYQLTSLTFTPLAASQRVTASTNGGAVDLSLFTGNALFVLNASATEGAGQTADLKIQTSADGATGWVDAGISFAQVTNAGASYQKVLATTDGLKKYARVVSTLGGTSPAVTYGVTVIGKTSLG
jgi:hypothetical protein